MIEGFAAEGMFLGAAGLVEEVLEFVDFGVKLLYNLRLR